MIFAARFCSGREGRGRSFENLRRFTATAGRSRNPGKQPKVAAHGGDLVTQCGHQQVGLQCAYFNASGMQVRWMGTLVGNILRG
jgi:hypothetical protein